MFKNVFVWAALVLVVVCGIFSMWHVWDLVP